MKSNLKQIFARLFVLTSLSTVACNSNLEDPLQVEKSESLVLDARKTTAPVTSKVRVYARVPLESGLQDVAFATSGGVFLESNDKAVKQLTDSISGNYRYAPVFISGVKDPSTIFITAEVKGLRQRITIVFQ